MSKKNKNPLHHYGEHIICCLSGAPSNERVIRAAARMAEAFGGTFTAVFVEIPGYSGWSEDEQKRLMANLHLAEELGAHITTLYGDDPAVQIAEYSRASGTTKIVLGLGPGAGHLFSRSPSLLNRLRKLAPDLDIYIIPDQNADKWHRPDYFVIKERFSIRDFLRMAGILAICTAIGFLLHTIGLTTTNVMMVYILGVLIISMLTTGRSYSILSTALSVLIYNFFFTEPYFTLRSAPDSFATFSVMFIVALLGSTLTTRIKQQAVLSANKAYRTEILLETSQKLQKAEDGGEILTVAATQLRKLLECDMVCYPVTEDNVPGRPLSFPLLPENSMEKYLTEEEHNVADWVVHNNKHAGVTTKNHPEAQCLYLAVRGSKQVLAVVGIALDQSDPPEAFEKSLMIAILDECGLALEKDAMVRAKQKVEETARQEALRANLLRSISHDLRTPLTSISGNAAILMESGINLPPQKLHGLYSAIYDDAQWLTNLVENLLSITRIENGNMALRCEPELLEDVIHEAMRHLDRGASHHTIRLELTEELLMTSIDAQLIIQVIINIMNNAIKYTPEGSLIILSMEKQEKNVLIKISDNGPGIPDSAKEHLFEMFFTANKSYSDSRRGLGLGLALCKSIVNAHGGTIRVQDNHPSGACFCFTLPISEVNLHE